MVAFVCSCAGPSGRREKLVILWLLSRLSKADKDICFLAEILKKSILTSSILSLFPYLPFLTFCFIMEKQSFELSFSITVSGLSGAMDTMRGTMKAGDICPMRLLFLSGINFESLYRNKLCCMGPVLVTFLITTTKYLAKAPSG